MTKEPSSKLEELIVALQQLQLTGTEIAEVLWLAHQRQQFAEKTEAPPKPEEPETVTQEQTSTQKNPLPQTSLPTPPPTTAIAEVYTKSGNSTSTSANTLSIKAPDASALRQPLKLMRALRPLMQKIPSGTEIILDEEATANRIAEERIRIPVLKSALEPALDLALVVDESNTMIFWQKTVQELQKLLETQGAFRDVQTWGLVTNNPGNNPGNNPENNPENNPGNNQEEIFLRRGTGKKAYHHRLHKPRELVDPSGRRLILVVSDCVSDIWRNGKALSVLRIWSQKSPVAILQMLPQWLWLRTGLSSGAKVQLGSLTPRIVNQGLLIKEILLWDDINFATGTKIPVLTLEPEVALNWSNIIAGKSFAKVSGFVFSSETLTEADRVKEVINAEIISNEEIVSSFRRTASPIARKLASLLSSAPVITLPIVRLIQENMLKESQQVHVAEVFLGGIFKATKEITPLSNPDEIEFRFINEETRDIFLNAAPAIDALAVVDAISKYFAKKLNKTMSEFNALLRKPEQTNIEGLDIKPFAIVTAKVLRRLGGDYVRFAEELEGKGQISSAGGTGQEIVLETFGFDVATVEVIPAKGRRGTPEINIVKHREHAQFFPEKLPDNITLEMVSIPGGKFIMGSPKTEEESSNSERPQHEVTVPPFFMGKYPITQAQWRAVATLPQVNRILNPNPSRFKGDDLPVETISWDEAVEFCDRISKYTGKNYRLPSEAEWEYACRGGTTTPFHFGETITPGLANYNGEYTYGSGTKGENRRKTTPVGSFKVANAFGLFDMHGNVLERCLDDWHENYEDAPNDGSPRLKPINENDNRRKMLRGGSWFVNPENCRSASRDNENFGFNDDNVGFRVVFASVAYRFYMGSQKTIN